MLKTKSQLPVQGTNDSSIISKFSMASRGYFCDKFLKFFAAKHQHRSPLINRGYYIRAKAMERMFHQFFQTVFGFPDIQIISLGAGFDTSYFRLESEKFLCGTKFIEVDFEGVITRKMTCINSHSILKDMMPEDTSTSSNKSIIFQGRNYILIGADLRVTCDLDKALEDAGISFESPTLIFSECAMTYMEVESSNRLIEWAAKKFPNAAFVTYEQIHPDDGFGLIMQKHFQSLGSPLRSIQTFQTEKSQENRYKNLCWTECYVLGMNQLFSMLPLEEQKRIQSLELFDEFEEWHLKCSHYILACASQGVLASFSKALCSDSCKDKQNKYEPVISKRLHWTVYEHGSELQRFGQQCVLLPNGLVLTCGGFGIQDGKHQRLGGCLLTDVTTKTFQSWKLELEGQGHHMGQRIHHCTVLLNDQKLVVIGGRSSPSKAYNEILTLKIKNSTTQTSGNIVSAETRLLTPQCSSTSSESPSARWRHTACVVKLGGIEKIMVFGGRAPGCKVLASCFILETEKWTWEKVPQDQPDAPGPRHSHSCAVWESVVVLSGGIDSEEQPVAAVHTLDLSTLKWKQLFIPSFIPRYSHTSHIWKDNLILVGGVNTLPTASPGVGVVDLQTCQYCEWHLPCATRREMENLNLWRRRKLFFFRDSLELLCDRNRSAGVMWMSLLSSCFC
ncbi:tRNA wybutosine-synthesizing protein 4-like isoform X2 [Limulus polyphemus]|uniref:tRNA wybutosine-synthesizing protein 4 n=1 Tax=Limulus polyphemus TaxID=6850 RepID=A0ABM1T1E3_LIMPO|nr:tRNA wybutosine-synthesizing protein 4-like isoform X2 [Limulus polyphemus]XP_022249700.1 tRNA wybutosine-synthesizing protein 4-like isoform X2 [Limulus polyphemus]